MQQRPAGKRNLYGCASGLAPHDRYQRTRRAGGQPLRLTWQGPLLSSQRAKRRTVNQSFCGAPLQRGAKVVTHFADVAFENFKVREQRQHVIFVGGVDHIDFEGVCVLSNCKGQLDVGFAVSKFGVGHLSSPCFDDPIYPQSAYGVNNEIRNLRIFLH